MLTLKYMILHSVLFLVVTFVRSPRKVVSFITKKMCLQDQSIPKMFHLILKTKSLLAGASALDPCNIIGEKVYGYCTAENGSDPSRCIPCGYEGNLCCPGAFKVVTYLNVTDTLPEHCTWNSGQSIRLISPLSQWIDKG